MLIRQLNYRNRIVMRQNNKMNLIKSKIPVKVMKEM